MSDVRRRVRVRGRGWGSRGRRQWGGFARIAVIGLIEVGVAAGSLARPAAGLPPAEARALAVAWLLEGANEDGSWGRDLRSERPDVHELRLAPQPERAQRIS